MSEANRTNMGGSDDRELIEWPGPFRALDEQQQEWLRRNLVEPLRAQECMAMRGRVALYRTASKWAMDGEIMSRAWMVLGKYEDEERAKFYDKDHPIWDKIAERLGKEKDKISVGSANAARAFLEIRADEIESGIHHAA